MPALGREGRVVEGAQGAGSVPPDVWSWLKAAGTNGTIPSVVLLDIGPLIQAGAALPIGRAWCEAENSGRLQVQTEHKVMTGVWRFADADWRARIVGLSMNLGSPVLWAIQVSIAGAMRVIVAPFVRSAAPAVVGTMSPGTRIARPCGKTCVWKIAPFATI